MRLHFIVTNIDITTQRIFNQQGQAIILPPGKSAIVSNPPKSSYIFKVEPLTNEMRKIYFNEVKSDKLGEVLITESQHKQEKQEEKLKKYKEVKK